MQSETLFKIELKYCELCGGLFLRREANPQVFCVTCNPVMERFAQERKKPPQSVKAVAFAPEAACV